jgi:hypothetical protein
MCVDVLSVVMLSIVMLTVVMLSVVASFFALFDGSENRIKFSSEPRKKKLARKKMSGICQKTGLFWIF